MTDELDPRLEAAARAAMDGDLWHGAFDGSLKYEGHSQERDVWIFRAERALAAADASDAERGVVRVQQSDIDNDRARIAAAERAGREIRKTLGLPSMADWSAVLAATSGVPRIADSKAP